MVSRLKSDEKVVGVKQVKRALVSQEVHILYLAKDVDENIREEILDLADEGIQVIEPESMVELGEACGIDVNAATAALLK